MHPTFPLLKATDFPAIRRQTLDTLQVNLGYKCNQSCLHCHVGAGPNRIEMMDAAIVWMAVQADYFSFRGRRGSQIGLHYALLRRRCLAFVDVCFCHGFLR